MSIYQSKSSYVPIIVLFDGFICQLTVSFLVYRIILKNLDILNLDLWSPLLPKDHSTPSTRPFTDEATTGPKYRESNPFCQSSASRKILDLVNVYPYILSPDRMSENASVISFPVCECDR